MRRNPPKKDASSERLDEYITNKNAVSNSLLTFMDEFLKKCEHLEDNQAGFIRLFATLLRSVNEASENSFNEIMGRPFDLMKTNKADKETRKRILAIVSDGLLEKYMCGYISDSLDEENLLLIQQYLKENKFINLYIDMQMVYFWENYNSAKIDNKIIFTEDQMREITGILKDAYLFQVSSDVFMRLTISEKVDTHAAKLYAFLIRVISINPDVDNVLENIYQTIINSGKGDLDLSDFRYIHSNFNQRASSNINYNIEKLMLLLENSMSAMLRSENFESLPAKLKIRFLHDMYKAMNEEACKVVVENQSKSEVMNDLLTQYKKAVETLGEQLCAKLTEKYIKEFEKEQRREKIKSSSLVQAAVMIVSPRSAKKDKSFSSPKSGKDWFLSPHKSHESDEDDDDNKVSKSSRKGRQGGKK